MGDVYFTTNPSEWTRLPGLYISEQAPTAFIQGADLSTIAFAGRCVRGPTTPQDITSVGRFLDVYGARDYGDGGAIIGQVWAALANKPFGAIVVRRVVASDAVLATKTLSNVTPTAIVRVDATSKGVWGNDIQVAVDDATDGDADHFNLIATYRGKTVTYQDLDVSAANVDNTLETIGDDIANLIVVTKLANGRPLNSAAASLTTGAEGTLAVADYNAGMNEIAVYPGVAACLVPEAVPTPATFHSNLVTLAAEVADRVFLTWAQAHGQAVATEITQANAQITTRTDRIWWCYNSPYTLDPSTSTKFQQAPHIWMASIISQNDVDVHPGAAVTTKQTAGASSVTNTSLSRSDLIALKEAGISTLERLTDRRNRSSRFQFRDAVTTDLTSGKTEITRRRMTDFLQLSASDRLRDFVKEKGTTVNRALMAAEVTAFSQDLMDGERIVQAFSVEQKSVNTSTDRAKGLEKLLWTVDLVDHMLSIVLMTDIGTGVTVQVNQPPG